MTSFIQKDVWKRLKQAAKTCRGPAHVAVAYFGKGAARLLPLRPGSKLVVDASDHAVKAGLTHPNDLRTLCLRGVRIYSLSNLHAKVFVFGKTAFVGSPNASRHSADILIESVVRTTDFKVVADIKTFVNSLCLKEVGPEELRQMQRKYRPPSIPKARKKAKGTESISPSQGLPRVWLAQVTPNDPPDGSQATLKAGERVAKRRLSNRRRFHVDHFWTHVRCPYRENDIVVQVVKETNGKSMVMPPGTVIHVKPWVGHRQTFIFQEAPRRSRKSISVLSKRLGTGAKARLMREGRVSREFAARLMKAWNL